MQKPESADVPFMPAHAIANLTPDYILDVDGILKFIDTVTA